MEIFNTLAMASSNAQGQQGGGSMMFIIMIVVMFALMYFLTIRPQKKQQKKEQELRDNTQIGDEITTIGGICGRVISVKDDTIVIETGSDKNRIKFKKYAIQTNHTANEKLQAEREAAKAAMEEQKGKKSKRGKKSKDEDKEVNEENFGTPDDK